MTSRNQAILIILFAVFALPPLLSWFAFNYLDLGGQQGAAAHGTLVTPPRPLPDWTLVDLTNRDARETRLQGKWTLLYPLDGKCGEPCQQNLYRMRQLRLATGKYADRVQRAVLVVNGDRDAVTGEQLRDYPGQLLLFPGNMDGGALRALFELSAGDRPFAEERLYLVDPLGNLMMSYAGDVDPRGIIKDLTRLLKYSRTGSAVSAECRGQSKNPSECALLSYISRVFTLTPPVSPVGQNRWHRMKKGFLNLSITAFLLAFCVIVLGAYVRLSHAGLGCPDWPGCYGDLFVTEETRVAAAQLASGARPFDMDKAVKEMIHRYAAGILGILVLLMALVAWRSRHDERASCTILLGLVAFQALLGMWTVTELLKPLIVAAHLLGGLLILGLLYWIILRQLPHPAGHRGHAPTRRLALAALAVLAAQVFSGGWTSANYAALACPEFPACRDGIYWPETDFREAFTVWRAGRIDYEGGILDAPARTAIHLTHRLGAALTFLAVLSAGLCALAREREPARAPAAFLLLVLCIQVALGVANVLLRLPLPVAVAHNSVAALLMLSLLTLYRHARSGLRRQ